MPPNQNYKISPSTHEPEEMRFDLGDVPAHLVCPADGMKLQRIGSQPDWSMGDLRCNQCARRYGLA